MEDGAGVPNVDVHRVGARDWIRHFRGTSAHVVRQASRSSGDWLQKRPAGFLRAQRM
jgi:hypothetical protein